MNQKSTLTLKKRKAIAALLINSTVTAAAKSAGVGRSTLQRWLKEPDFKAALREAQTDRLERATVRLTGELPAAISTLSEIHQDEDQPASARVRAAALVLDYYMRFIDAYDLAERVESLEKMLSEVKV